MKTQKLKVRTHVTAGGMTANHNQKPLKVRTSVRAGGMTANHSQSIGRR